MHYSKKKIQYKVYNRRSFIILSGKISLLSVIGWKFFDIQYLQSEKYKTLSKNNQINVEIIYPLRGSIMDRNNLIIAKNLKSYDLYLIPEQCPNISLLLNKLDEFIDISFAKKRKIIELSKKVKKFERVQIINNISWDKLEIIEANKNILPGLHLYNSSKRIYPYGQYFSHILGYISKPSEEDLNLPYISGMPKLNIGKVGLEKFLNTDLLGKPGRREIEVNSSGREIREINISTSTQGKDFNLSIDSGLQKFVNKELENHKAGSIVVLNIENGEVLAMASIPNYDPNKIITKPNINYWNSLLENSLSPLTNRSIQGLYAPGSTFKLVVALSALKKGMIDLSFKNLCEGKIELGDRFYHCWKTKGHGQMNLQDAIKESCDVFFFELSKKIGIKNIAETAKEFGLGQIFNFGFENEKKGIIPTKKWKKQNIKESWYIGDTLNSSIGQGFVLSTPLQLAVMTARIASNGKKIQPSIFKQNLNSNFEKIDILEQYFDLVKDSMYKVVNESKGTAFNSRSNLYSFAGKTGTSQVKKITIEERESDLFRKQEIEWKNKDHALFVGYMPSEKPKYVLSVVIEHGGSGASIAAPIAKNTFDYIYNNKI